MSKAKNTTRKATKRKEPVVPEADVQQALAGRRLAALRMLCAVFFLFSGVFPAWVREIVDGITNENQSAKKAKKFVKQYFYTKHKSHREWLPVDDAIVRLPEILRALIANRARLHKLDFRIPEKLEPENVDDMISSLSPEHRTLVNDFMKVYAKFNGIYKFVTNPDLQVDVEPVVLEVFQRYGELRGQILNAHQGSIVKTCSTIVNKYDLYFDESVKNHVNSFALDVIDRFDPNHNVKIGTWIVGGCKYECMTYVTKVINRAKHEKQDLLFENSEGKGTTLTNLAPDPKTKTPDEIAINMEAFAMMYQKLDEMHQHPTMRENLRIYLCNKGLVYENGKLRYTKEDAKTFAELGEEYGFSPQAAFNRAESVRRELAIFLEWCNLE